MSSVPEANPFAPPTAHVEDIEVRREHGLAGRGRRFCAAVVDGLIGIGIAWAVWSMSPLATLVGSGAWSVWNALVVQLMVGLAGFALIHGWLLARRGQTIGKVLLGLRILRSNGERASLARLLGLRYFLGGAIQAVPVVGMLYALVDSLLIFRESRQCLHDNIADTVVVNA